MLSILIYDSDTSYRKRIKEALSSTYIEVDITEASSSRSAFNLLKKNAFVLILWQHSSEEGADFQSLKQISNLAPESHLILLTEKQSILDIVKLIKSSDFNCLNRKIPPIKSIIPTINKVLEIEKLKNKAKGLQCHLSYSKNQILIPDHPKYKKCLDHAIKLCKAGLSILIEGETGTGKSLFAEYVHQHTCPDGPFIPMNSGGVDREFLNSELFGHVRGAYTGAESAKQGNMELADKGILFLDEIGNMPMDIQAKILTAIETKTFQRMGCNKIMHSDFRLISATNKDLHALVKKQEFREDLLFRIRSTRSIRLPSLREMPEVIPFYVHHYLDRYNQKYAKQFTVSDSLMKKFQSLPWKGNLRQLNTVILEAIATDDHPFSILDCLQHLSGGQPTHPDIDNHLGLDEHLSKIEKYRIEDALKENNFNLAKTAEQLKIYRSRLHRLLKKHRIKN